MFNVIDKMVNENLGLFKLSDLSFFHPKKILCFPYAGGTYLAFAPLAKYLEGAAEIWAIEPPGHLNTQGKAEDNIESLCNRYIDNIPTDLISSEVILLGHSLGAYIACCFASYCIRKNICNPKLILGGAPPPNLRSIDIKLSSLTLKQLVEFMIKINGLPVAWKENPDLLAFFEEPLRADFVMYENFKFPDNIKALDVMVLSAYDDKLCPPHNFFAWEEYFFNLRLNFLPGNHLFLIENPQIMSHYIKLFL